MYERTFFFQVKQVFFSGETSQARTFRLCGYELEQGPNTVGILATTVRVVDSGTTHTTSIHHHARTAPAGGPVAFQPICDQASFKTLA